MNVVEAVASGLAATVALDLWQRLLKLTLGLPPTSWALVGRWTRQALAGRPFPGVVAHLSAGPNELRLGWIVHYTVGIGYGLVYVLGLRAAGFDPDSLAVGLVFGVASVAVPWFFFMPAMGAGLMARNTPKPLLACTLALAGHTVFGLGLALGSRVV